MVKAATKNVPFPSTEESFLKLPDEGELYKIPHLTWAWKTSSFTSKTKIEDLFLLQKKIDPGSEVLIVKKFVLNARLVENITFGSYAKALYDFKILFLNEPETPTSSLFITTYYITFIYDGSLCVTYVI
jgi:hypothetical protein